MVTKNPRGFAPMPSKGSPSGWGPMPGRRPGGSNNVLTPSPGSGWTGKQPPLTKPMPGTPRPGQPGGMVPPPRLGGPGGLLGGGIAKQPRPPGQVKPAGSSGRAYAPGQLKPAGSSARNYAPGRAGGPLGQGGMAGAPRKGGGLQPIGSQPRKNPGALGGVSSKNPAPPAPAGSPMKQPVLPTARKGGSWGPAKGGGTVKRKVGGQGTTAR